MNATVTNRPIAVAVSGSGQITATVTPVSVSATVSGGVGPQGPQGNAGGSLSQLNDVQIEAAASGDVLRYSDGKWRDYADAELLDGGNF